MGQGTLSLLDYRRQVAIHYAEVRGGSGSVEERWKRWRKWRDELLKNHPQSPLTEDARAGFEGLSYFDYDPKLRFEVGLDTVARGQQLAVELDQDGPLALEILGLIHFKVNGAESSLEAYWLTGYGGGLFLPFRDGTNGSQTYGGGRYLLDTIKGADLGGSADRVILDFNFAYNPSCAYNPRWHCPLAPTANWLELEIKAGELDFSSTGVEGPDPTAIPQLR